MNAPDEARRAWDAIAAGYDRFVTPTHMSLASQGLALAGVSRGTHFLDVAAGSGALSIPAAHLGAQVLATDLSSVMLEQLRARAASERLANIETRVMDGHALELPDASFDVVGSQFGVMLFPDMQRALREMARVARPGGRVLMTVFGDPRKVEFLRFFFQALRSVVPDFTGFSMDDPPLPFQLRDPTRLRDALAGAGLTRVHVETTVETLEFATGGELWDWLVSSNPIVGSVLGGLDLSRTQFETVRQALERSVRGRAGAGEKARLTNPINIGIGTR